MDKHCIWLQRTNGRLGKSPRVGIVDFTTRGIRRIPQWLHERLILAKVRWGIGENRETLNVMLNSMCDNLPRTSCIRKTTVNTCTSLYL